MQRDCRHRGPKCKLRAGYRVPSLKWTICCNYVSSSSVVSHTFRMLCMYSKFGNHPHPLGYLCAKFCVFCGLHHSLNQLIWCTGNRSLRSGKKTTVINRFQQQAILTDLCSIPQQQRNHPHDMYYHPVDSCVRPVKTRLQQLCLGRSAQVNDRSCTMRTKCSCAFHTTYARSSFTVLWIIVTITVYGLGW